MKSARRASVGAKMALLPILFLVAALGCGGKKGTITGTVTIDGKPVTSGQVTFYPEKEKAKPISGPIREEGYSVSGVPVGPAKITVTTSGRREFDMLLSKEAELKRNLQTAQAMKPPKDAPVANPAEKFKEELAEVQKKIKATRNAPEAPKAVTDVKTTPLSYTVTGGKQEHPIEISKK